MARIDPLPVKSGRRRCVTHWRRCTTEALCPDRRSSERIQHLGRDGPSPRAGAGILHPQRASAAGHHPD